MLKPKDDQDPDANNNKGKRCKFIKYSAVSKDYVVVQFSTKGKPMTFRAADFELAQPGDSDES